MNVVGKGWSLISKGVYSVATPFHPFGGAVDIIVVQQQDGTFRSTPWYVRFGKFQGVFKGAEKMVRISVNGVEADFHMYLDNSGEAYFVREVVSGEGRDVNRVLKDSDSLEGTQEGISVTGDNNFDSDRDNDNLCDHEGGVSSGEVQLQDERVLGVGQIERTESDIERKFYEFQDEQSSLEDSVEFSEYGSNRYENLDSVDHYVESQNLSSEVVLVSIDGHILTAPILSLEKNTDNLQLSTPQFHLGPGQETDFCEGNGGFSTGEDAWAANYLSDLGSLAPKVVSESSICILNNTNNASGHQLELCERDGEHPRQIQENENVADLEQELCADSNLDDGIRREDIFKSCLELTALIMHDGSANQQTVDSPFEIHESADTLREKSPQSLQLSNGTGDGDGDESRNGDGVTYSDSGPPGSMMFSNKGVEVELIGERPSTGHICFDNIPTHSVSPNEELEEQVDNSLAVEEIQCVAQGSAPEDECSISEDVEVELQTGSPSDGIKTDSRLEISLCGNLLHAGMGLNAAAEVFNSHRITEEAFKISAASIINNENLVVRVQDRYLPWDKAAPIVLGVAAYGLDLPVDPKDAIPVEQDETPKLGDDGCDTSTPPGRRWRLWPIPFRRVKTLEHTTSDSSSEEVFVDSESVSLTQPVESTPVSTGGSESPHKHIRTNVPTTEQISSLNLKEGQNMVTFSFSTRVWGLQKVDAHIYLWKWNARIVISDVDGTITKSDVLGQFMPLVGRDWTQSGVARLFSAIKENGYQLLFLSARAIVQAYLTRSYLLNLKQDGKALPSGPVVISPDGLFPSLYREVIRRAPHEFKIACLEDIKALFPPDYNPFYAGFGNRDTDELSYRKIGIPKGKIFIINPKGEVAISHRIDVKSYTSLHTLVNDMFPPTSMVEQEDFNAWNYWKMPLPDIE
ncbi:Phosphatidate phosphatase [Actinidia chinensis var. chinensis]|uniref:phosphatidate phosphatase n=1 Tax=Actinidia chinensis var. chinensis TaxID=1590841 RepID=A0A2R6PWS7_ACTCC|nr:Phosphatidate phosphatase [Actinidia chinensis var. chinensis]